MRLKVFVPASIGNVGPGFDVLGLALESLGDIFEFHFKDPSMPINIEVEGLDANLVPIDPKLNTVSIAACYFAGEIVGKAISFDLKIKRSLPIAGGLGSSAASSVAGAFAAASYFDRMDLDLMIRAALEAESYVAGRHLDNIAPSLLGGLCVVEDNEQGLRANRVDVGIPLFYTLMTPSIRLDTKSGRGLLSKNLKTQDWVKQMGLTSSLLLGFVKGDCELIRRNLIDPFAAEQRKHAIPGYEQARQRALNLGSLGFCMSGSGPSCFAVSCDEATAIKVGEECSKLLDSDFKVSMMAHEGARVIT